MADVELYAQLTLIKELVAHMYRNAFIDDPAAFEAVMDGLSKSFQFSMTAPEHATADDAEWLQALQTQVLKDAEKFRHSTLSAIRQHGA